LSILALGRGGKLAALGPHVVSHSIFNGLRKHSGKAASRQSSTATQGELLDMCKFESSQKDESRWQSTDSSKAYRNTRPSAFKCSNGLLFHMTQPTSRSTIKVIACSKPTIYQRKLEQMKTQWHNS